jgi:hypothetical protein
MPRAIQGRRGARLLLAGTCAFASIALSGPRLAGAKDINTNEVAAANAVEGPRLQHCDDAVKSRDFPTIFFCGDKLFETPFTTADGIGANIGNGRRFTRVPLAKLNGPGQWAREGRDTGPNATSCVSCHSQPDPDGAGDASSNNVRDPLMTGDPLMFIERNPPSTAAEGVQQLIAEEINEDLQQVVANAKTMAKSTSKAVTLMLDSKGINFGSVTAQPDGRVKIDAKGIDPDLVPKFADWKGDVVSVRAFVRGAFLNELGLDPVELGGDNTDRDADGVMNEITVADVTAMALYQAAQPAPTTRLAESGFKTRLMAMGSDGRALANRLKLATVSDEEAQSIERGGQAFMKIGCGDCHRPMISLRGRIFSEPSRNPNFREAKFPAGQDPVARGVDPNNPLTFDIAAEDGKTGPVDNLFQLGDRLVKVPNAVVARGQGADVALFGDLRLHDMGPGLAEPIDSSVESGLKRGNSVFMTENLWGVGSTAPYLHDGRAATITEAILAHGGEAQASRDAFVALDAASQKDVDTFLKNNKQRIQEGFLAKALDNDDSDDADGSDASDASDGDSDGDGT